ncbi:3128_t:CDS:2 [Ambispora gerdemannii]|uniref:3128_t:CDS:1 n=1 Tax=Ambispora gerdemannii TaxID=144530 RepID=A0A9N8V8S7_9GLOM|nr:3128_t:CDS:2 [Ambispora gerdemannii]
MESLLTLINEVVDRPPSLTTSNTHPPQPPPPILSHNNPFDINKDGHDSSDNKGKVQLSNSLPTPIFKSSISAALNLSVIPEQTELMTTVAESKLESRLLTTTNSTSKTLLSEGSSSSSDENSVSSLNSLESNNNKELAISEQEGKRVIEEVKEEDSSVIKKQACEISDILPQSSSPSFAIHSDKSILGEYYPNIKEPPSSVSVSPAPTPLLMAGDRYPPMTPLRSIKDFTRAGVLTSREVRYPSPGTFFAGKSGPLGDISGRLSPSKRPRFFSPNSNRNERWPTPTIDTTRPERSGRKTMEGWPTSPRRMQLASPRFKSLTDLVEETSENPEQIEIGGKRPESLKLPVQVSQKNISSLSLLEENDAIIKGSDEKKINYEEIQKEKIPADPEDDKEKEKENTPGKFSSRSVPLSEIVQSNDSEIPSKRFQSRSRSFAPKPPPIFSLRRSSASFKSLYNMPPLVENSELEEDIGEEEEEALDSTPTPSPIIKSSDLTSSSDIGRSIIQTSDINLSPRDSQTKKPGDNNFLRSIQTRRTERNVLTLKTRTNLLIISETEDEDDDESKSPDIAQTFNDRNISPPKSAPLLTSSTFDISPTSSKTSWRWPKRQFSPAREKCKEPNDSNDDPSMHIGKVGNLWAKKTLGQLRAYHKRHSPSIWSKGFGSSNSSSPLKETFSSVQISPVTPVAPVSDVEAIKSPMTPNLPVADQLETIDEEDDEEIGVWSSEEVDLTDSGKEDKKPNPPSPSSSIPINPSSIIEEITEPPQGMKVSPEHLTVVGGTAVYRENSPSSSNTSLQLRTNPNNSSLGKHNAKPLFETTFTISNITDRPLRYEILWPAFRFDVSPAYGIVQAKGVTVVKISVLMKHLNVGSKRDEIKDSKKLMGMLKGSTRIDKEKPLMGHTRILVLCENGERREVLVDIVQVKKKSKELEPVKNIKNVKDGGNTSTNRTFISGVSRTVGDLLMGKKLRKEKSNVKGKNPVIVDNNNNHNITSGSKLSRRSRSTSRNTSPDGKKVHSNRNKPSNRISRPSTPDYKLVDRRVSTSPQPIISRSRTPEEFRQLPQRKNLIYLGVPGNISCPDTNIRETANGVFRIHNPTNKHISWHLTTATNPFLKRSESSSQQKITDEVFLIMKTHGFLRPGQSERVDVSFRPLFVGTYVQNFMLEESMNSEAAGGLGGVSLRMQGEGKPDNSSSTLNERRRGIRGVDFVVSEKEIRIPTTRVGRRRSIGIKIENPSPQLIRIRCKCEVVSGAIGTSVLSIPLSSVQIKPKAFVLLPVRFQPKESGETKGVVKLQAVGKTEVKVDIIADEYE